MSWNDESIRTRKALIKHAVAQGITDLQKIKEIYNRESTANMFDDGGETENIPLPTKTYIQKADIDYDAYNNPYKYITDDNGNIVPVDSDALVVKPDYESINRPYPWNNPQPGSLEIVSPEALLIPGGVGPKALKAGVNGLEKGLGYIARTFPRAATAAKYGFAVDGAYRLASDEGIRKTADLLSNGEYTHGVVSGLGDIMDATMAVPLAKKGYEIGEGLNWALDNPIGRTADNISNAYNYTTKRLKGNARRVGKYLSRIRNFDEESNRIYDRVSALKEGNMEKTTAKIKEKFAALHDYDVKKNEIEQDLYDHKVDLAFKEDEKAYIDKQSDPETGPFIGTNMDLIREGNNGSPITTTTSLPFVGDINSKYYLNGNRYLDTRATPRSIYNRSILSPFPVYGSESSSKSFNPPTIKEVDKLREYYNKVQEDFDGLGTVAGSTLLHSKFGTGIPNDIELIAPISKRVEIEAKLGELKDLGNGFAYRGKYKNSPNGEIDVDFIQERNGHAVGGTAHQIYRSLFPKEYTDMMRKLSVSKENFNDRNGAKIEINDVELPISADELYEVYKKEDNPLKQVTKDMLGSVKRSTSGESLGKAQRRSISAAFDNENAKFMTERVNEMGRLIAGESWKTVDELMPNLDYTDIEANKQFLKDILSFSDEEAEILAHNPESMKYIIQKMELEEIATRALKYDPDYPFDVNKSMFENISYTNSNSHSGAGLNFLTKSEDPGGVGGEIVSARYIPSHKLNGDIKNVLEYYGAKIYDPTFDYEVRGKLSEVKTLLNKFINNHSNELTRDVNEADSGMDSGNLIENIFGDSGILTKLNNFAPSITGDAAGKPITEEYRNELSELTHKVAELLDVYKYETRYGGDTFFGSLRKSDPVQLNFFPNSNRSTVFERGLGFSKKLASGSDTRRTIRDSDVFGNRDIITNSTSYEDYIRKSLESIFGKSDGIDKFIDTVKKQGFFNDKNEAAFKDLKDSTIEFSKKELETNNFLLKLKSEKDKTIGNYDNEINRLESISKSYDNAQDKINELRHKNTNKHTLAITTSFYLSSATAVFVAAYMLVNEKGRNKRNEILKTIKNTKKRSLRVNGDSINDRNDSIDMKKINPFK